MSSGDARKAAQLRPPRDFAPRYFRATFLDMAPPVDIDCPLQALTSDSRGTLPLFRFATTVPFRVRPPEIRGNSGIFLREIFRGAWIQRSRRPIRSNILIVRVPYPGGTWLQCTGQYRRPNYDKCCDPGGGTAADGSMSPAVAIRLAWVSWLLLLIVPFVLFLWVVWMLSFREGAARAWKGRPGLSPHRSIC